MTITRDEIMAMTPEELRIEIAKVKGWTNFVTGYFSSWTPYNGEPLEAHHLETWATMPDGEVRTRQIPNWPIEIAAAWELEDTLPDDNARYEYTRLLTWVINRIEPYVTDQRFMLIHATPLLRARAWLMWKTEAE
ncbi:hypothetical protein CCP3SC15_1930008 [Gammaproteobacteria bacterium]